MTLKSLPNPPINNKTQNSFSPTLPEYQILGQQNEGITNANALPSQHQSMSIHSQCTADALQM